MIVFWILNISQCYEILGLKPGATVNEIIQAYRSLVLKYHPDKDTSEGNESRFKEIFEAYQTLRSQYKNESKILKKFGDLYPEDAVSFYEQADVLIRTNNYEEAIIFYDKALSLLPRYEKAWLKKGDALSHLKRYEQALYCYDKVLKINPTSSNVWNLRGICLSDLKKIRYGTRIF